MPVDAMNVLKSPSVPMNTPSISMPLPSILICEFKAAGASAFSRVNFLCHASTALTS